jgi:hypothetical protein
VRRSDAAARLDPREQVEAIRRLDEAARRIDRRRHRERRAFLRRASRR